jgi:hypothetical protein
VDVVIDAQVVKAFYEETVIGSLHNLTDSPVPIFDRLGNLDVVSLDQGGQIESEWRNTLDPEWFDPWLAQLFISGAAKQIPTKTCQSIRNQLSDLGFPTRGRAGRDFWYIRTAIAVIEDLGPIPHGKDPLVYLISDDLHFHNPREFGTATKPRRIQILIDGNGPVVKFLRDTQRIGIICVKRFLLTI